MEISQSARRWKDESCLKFLRLSFWFPYQHHPKLSKRHRMPKSNPVLDGFSREPKGSTFLLEVKRKPFLLSQRPEIVFGCVALNGKQKEAFRRFIRGTNGHILFLLVQPKYVPTQGSQTTNSHPGKRPFQYCVCPIQWCVQLAPGLQPLGKSPLVNKELGPFWANHEAKPK